MRKKIGKYQFNPGKNVAESTGNRYSASYLAEQAFLRKQADEALKASRVPKQTVVAPTKDKSPYQKQQTVVHNRRVAAENPFFSANEEGNLEPSAYGNFITNNQKTLGKVDNMVTDLGLISFEMLNARAVGALGKYATKGMGKYLAEQTVFKNAYKLNPYAFKPNPEMMYRGIGKEGAEDALTSGVFRAKQNVQPDIRNGFDFSKQFNSTYYTPKFKTADQYGAGYIAEVPKDAAVFRNRYSKGKDWSQIADENIPIEKGKILQKDWLKRYKEIPKGTNSLDNTYWNGKAYQQGPLSNPRVTRGPINYWEEPGFAARNPNFNHEAYINSVNKFGETHSNVRNANLDPYIKYRQYGGEEEEDDLFEYAQTEEQKRNGLNNSDADQMFFPMQGANEFRGLDSGEPVTLYDQQGQSQTLYGPKDTATMNGNVMEYRQYGGDDDDDLFVYKKAPCQHCPNG